MAERSDNYPTGNGNGMSFIGNRWVFTGPQGYAVRPNDDGTFRVVSYHGTAERVAGSIGLSLPEDDAHALAERLASR